MILKIIKLDTIFEGMFFLAMNNMLKDNDLSEKSNVVSTGFWTGPGLVWRAGTQAKSVSH